MFRATPDCCGLKDGLNDLSLLAVGEDESGNYGAADERGGDFCGLVDITKRLVCETLREKTTLD